MAGLRSNQFLIDLNTIYHLIKFDDDFSYVRPNIFFNGTGSVDVYVSEETPGSIDDMFKSDEGIIGHKAFKVKPNYICVVQNTPTIISIVITGIKPEAV